MDVTRQGNIGLNSQSSLEATCLQAQALGCATPFFYQQYPYVTCQHNIGTDEELLLNAIRRKPEMKAILLKTALTELLKEL